MKLTNFSYIDRFYPVFRNVQMLKGRKGYVFTASGTKLKNVNQLSG